MHDELRYRSASIDDPPAMERCRAADRAAGRADARIAAYLDGRHHPQEALASRTAFVALAGDDVVGYVAGHATTRFGCDGEVQYLYVTPDYRRRRIAQRLLREIAAWFDARSIHRVCVNVSTDNAGAIACYVRAGAVPLKPHWYLWEDIGSVAR